MSRSETWCTVLPKIVVSYHELCCSLKGGTRTGGGRECGGARPSQVINQNGILYVTYAINKYVLEKCVTGPHLNTPP